MGKISAAARLGALALVALAASASPGLGAPTCQVTIGKTVFGSLQEAVDAARPGDGLKVSGACTGGAVVDKSLSIRGIGSPATLTQTGSTTALLTVEEGVTLTMSGITISNSDDGGAIANAGTLVLKESTLSHNHSSGVGGGIYNTGSVTLLSSSFEDDSASFYGGALYNNGGTVVINSSTFTYNDGNAGGTIYNTGGGSVTAHRCDISHGFAAEGTGGVESFSGMIALEDCTLTGNNSQDDAGGAIQNRGGALAVSRCTVTGNLAQSGGGIANFGVAEVTNTYIAHNYAPVGGGGLSNSGTLTMNRRTVVTQNAVDPEIGHGGGILNDGTLVGAVAGGNVYDNTPDDIYP